MGLTGAPLWTLESAPARPIHYLLQFRGTLVPHLNLFPPMLQHYGLFVRVPTGACITRQLTCIKVGCSTAHVGPGCDIPYHDSWVRSSLFHLPDFSAFFWCGFRCYGAADMKTGTFYGELLYKLQPFCWALHISY